MIVTRFAPSPTGYLHIGGARTALFNWLFARHAGGQFILRIEDTDQKRNTPTATKQVIDDLRWLGIDWDQGPEVQGPNAPYFQSQRRDIYQKYIDQLLAQNKAYYCFETPEELQKMRLEAQNQKKGFLYPRPEIFPTDQDVKKARDQGRDVTVRFAMPAEPAKIVVTDIVRGEVTFSVDELGDFIIQKSDGFPTYNFACVVDDALMAVTHVIRGQEHLMNTPSQMALQQALALPTPEYAHMSVTISQQGGKLSKRERPKTLLIAIKNRKDLDLEQLAKAGSISSEQLNDFIKGKSVPDMPAIEAMAKFLGVNLPEINVVDFFKSGYLPETLINFVALLGWNPGYEQEILTVEQLIKDFELPRLTKSNSLFDRKKLISFNTEHIRLVGGEKLLSSFKEFLKEVDSPLSRADDELLQKLLEINAGARTLVDIDKKSRFLFFEDDKIEYDPAVVKKVLLKEGALEILAIIGGRLETLKPLTEESIEQMLRGLAEEKGVGLGKVAQPLRVAISGSNISPPIFDSVKLLGVKRTIKRIGITIEKFQAG